MSVFGRWLREHLFRGPTGRHGPGVTGSRTPPSGSQTFAQKNNEFAVSLFHQLHHRVGNLFFSPFSIRTVLAMAWCGARGRTATQMGQALHIEPAEDGTLVGFSEMIDGPRPVHGGKGDLNSANSLWFQRGEPLLPDFLELMEQHFGGGTSLVDFRGEAEAARKAINEWVETQTKGKIRDLIPVGGLDETTSLALVNAVYFAGTWAMPFHRRSTKEETFHLDGGGSVKASLMYQEEEVLYSKGSGVQVVDLAYEGSGLSMLVILPNRKNGLRAVEKKLSVQMLTDCVAGMQLRTVKLFLPRFKFAWGTVDLRSALEKLGMSLAFKPFEADFSGMNGLEPPSEDALVLSSVFHQAHVEVDEKGTTAAAATAATMIAGAALGPSRPPRIPVFRADHPFLFAIRDRRSGSIVFLGRISDPTQSH